MTPQTQITSKLFEGKEIRAIEYAGEVWVPIVDISEAWGMDRSTPTKIINRNPEIFAGLSTVVDVTSPTKLTTDSVGNTLRCVNEQGVYVLALKVSAGRIKNKEVKATIIRFQKWVPELIQRYRKGELVELLPAKNTTDLVGEQLDLADMAIKRSGVPKEIAHSMAWATVGTITGNELNHSIAGYIKAQTKQLSLPEAIPQDKADYDSYFSRKQLCEFLKLPDAKILNTLESLNIIYFENRIWHLTKKGEQYGKVFMVMPGYPYRMTQKAWIKYNPGCVELLKKYFEGEVKA